MFGMTAMIAIDAVTAALGELDGADRFGIVSVPFEGQIEREQIGEVDGNILDKFRMPNCEIVPTAQSYGSESVISCSKKRRRESGVEVQPRVYIDRKRMSSHL